MRPKGPSQFRQVANTARRVDRLERRSNTPARSSAVSTTAEQSTFTGSGGILYADVDGEIGWGGIHVTWDTDSPDDVGAGVYHLNFVVQVRLTVPRVGATIQASWYGTPNLYSGRNDADPTDDGSVYRVSVSGHSDLASPGLYVSMRGLDFNDEADLDEIRLTLISTGIE